MPTLKDRRRALGLTRKELAFKAYTDPPSVQLVELGHPVDQTIVDRLDQTLAALEAGEPAPDWKKKVDEDIANDPEASRFDAGG